jgi:pyrroloquinoline quinone biosynthesis protein B
MLLKILGSAAGGGLPQWNCACPNCVRARAGDPLTRARTNASLAISPDGEAWYIINASPYIHQQIEAFSSLLPGPSIRGTPILGILLTDAELDHTLGLLQLRESAELDIYAAEPVLAALSGPFPVRSIVERYARFCWKMVVPDESFTLFDGRLEIFPFMSGCKPPRYAADIQTLDQRGFPGAPWVLGYRITDRLTGGVAVYAPGIEAWTHTLQNQLSQADCVLIDGTFWEADELVKLGISDLTASDMGHIPITGQDGSLHRMAELPAKRKIFVHVNNTNPILDETSREFRIISSHGIEVGIDGLELEV